MQGVNDQALYKRMRDIVPLLRRLGLGNKDKDEFIGLHLNMEVYKGESKVLIES